MNPIKERKVN